MNKLALALIVPMAWMSTSDYAVRNPRQKPPQKARVNNRAPVPETPIVEEVHVEEVLVKEDAQPPVIDVKEAVPLSQWGEVLKNAKGLERQINELTQYKERKAKNIFSLHKHMRNLLESSNTLLNEFAGKTKEEQATLLPEAQNAIAAVSAVYNTWYKLLEYGEALQTGENISPEFEEFCNIDTLYQKLQKQAKLSRII